MLSGRELIAVASARLLSKRQRVLVGVGLPNLAVNLARRVHAPDLMLMYESGVIGARPKALPLSIGDPVLVEGALGVIPMSQLFRHYVQPGWIDVCFLGGAQIDRWGNLNSTVIGDYGRPTVRLSGSGGAADFSALAKRTIVLIPQEKKRFPEHVDFVTCAGHTPGTRRAGGPWRVVTDKAMFAFGTEGEMELIALMPGCTLEDVTAHVSWPVRFRQPLDTIAPPTPEEEAAVRDLLASGEAPQ